MLVVFHVLSALVIPFLYIHWGSGLSEKLLHSQPPICWSCLWKLPHAAWGNENSHAVPAGCVCLRFPVCFAWGVSSSLLFRVCYKQSTPLPPPPRFSFPSSGVCTNVSSAQQELFLSVTSGCCWCLFSIVTIRGRSFLYMWMVEGTCEVDIWPSGTCQKHGKWRDCCLSQGKKLLELVNRYEHLPMFPFLSVVASHFVSILSLWNILFHPKDFSIQLNYFKNKSRNGKLLDQFNLLFLLYFFRIAQYMKQRTKSFMWWVLFGFLITQFVQTT